MTIPKELSCIGSPGMYFSYNQFIVFDGSEKIPGSLWDDDHVRQGFVRREFSIFFSTLSDFGDAVIRVFIGSLDNFSCYERVISVPLHVI